MLSRCHKSNYAGFTLVELLVALTISVIVFAGVTAFYQSMIGHSNATLQATQLKIQLNSAMNLIVSDIKRAGYWANASAASTNPFTVPGVTDITTNIANDCVLFTYDRNKDGTLSVIAAGSDDEHYGYRKMGDVLQYRIYGSPFDCAALLTEWGNLTDPNVVRITTFSVVKSEALYPGSTDLYYRTVAITLTGQLVDDPTVIVSVSRVVEVQNDRKV